MPEMIINLRDDAATARLGADLARLLRRGDVVGLSGPLGAGKTTLARGLIKAIAGVSAAPSPTYALVETYDAGGMTLWHFDLYRLEAADDAYELGIEEALCDGASLIEWPERVAGLLPEDTLVIRLDDHAGGRRARIAGGGDWAARLKTLAGPAESPERTRMTVNTPSRADERADFLRRTPFAGAIARPLAGDASTRRYDRLTLDGRTALLMDAPPAAEAAACPPTASPDERRALGYNAMARLAGPNFHAFNAIADALRGAGLAAPEIFAADASAGFALLEDFGDDLYARAIEAGADAEALYAAAVDALLHLRAARPPAPQSAQYAMQTYDATALEAEIALVPDWYWAFRKGRSPDPKDRAGYFAAWGPALASISAPASIVLRDFHAENLFWLPRNAGVRRVGLIDFQDGLVGQPAYDLASLLEDARRDVDQGLAARMIARYCAGAARAGGFDEAAFRRDYAVLAAQRNAKILGIFARLVKRDGKLRYQGFLPRVESYFRADLQRPELAEVRRFIAAHFPGLAA